MRERVGSGAAANAVRAAAVAFAAAGALGAVPAGAQETAGIRQPVPIHRLDGPVVLDGYSDEPAWQAVQPLEMTMFSPTFGAPITERTEVRVAYDTRYLYVAGRMYDSDPDGIRANTYYRDRYSGDDLLAFIVDSYDDYDTGLWFAVNPVGTRTDRTVSNDGEFVGGDPMNADWNAHWDVAVARNAEGWFAEFRIPFSTLGFQTRDDVATMGLIVYRFIARKNERQIYPAIPPNWPLAFAKPSQAQRIRLTGVRARRPVYVTPYVLGGLQRVPRLEADPPGSEPGWNPDHDTDTEAGVDLKYSPSSNMALDLTVNTDFAQVESDAQQVNITRFALFFPEKRQFFQERASLFEFNTGGPNNRLFHSRRIGLGPDGEPTRIYGGARLVGRIGGTDIGVLDMQTASSDLQPSENVGVLRVRSRLFNPYSNAGVMLTSRLGDDGSSNVALGVDGQVRVVGDEYVILKWAQTFDDSVDVADVLEGALYQARWERRSERGLSYFADLRRAGRAYTPGLGFQSRFDFTFYGAQLQYKWFQSASSPLRSISALMYSGNYIRNADDSAESRALEPKIELEFESGNTVSATLLTSYESVREPFPIGDLMIPVGDYWFHEGQLQLELSRGALFRGDLTASAGSFYNGTRVALAANPLWNLSRNLELGGGYEINRISTDEDGSTTTHLARLRLLLGFDTHLSFSAFAQYNSTIDLTSINARVRYHFGEGTDLWIVYDEGLNTVRDVTGSPRLPGSAFRSLQIKYTHTLTF